MSFFRLRVHLGIIEDKIYSKLYSLQALQLSKQSRDRNVQDLSRMLEKWELGVPPDFRPDKISTTLPKSSASHMVILHLFFFHCLTKIHGVSFQSERWVTEALRLERQDVFASKFWQSLEICISAARDSLRLVRILPQGDFACIWSVLFLDPL